MGVDKEGRRIDYLRISVTDRCNLRCIYCMPEEGVEWKSHETILSYEEMVRFVKIAAKEGISHIRLTGGEPLVRAGLAGFISELNAIDGIENISLTTNGILLPQHADELKAAGLKRVNISLDTLDPDVFHSITRRGELKDVLHAIDVALETGFEPVKINAVVVRSLNQDLLGFAKLSVDRPLHVRFIEYMPVGVSSGTHGEGWAADESVPSDEVLERISREGEAAGLGALIPVSAKDAPGGSGPAKYYRFENALGTIGVISPLSHHFCGECNRLRLTADGGLRPCLFSDTELDVRSVLRSADDEAVRDVVLQALLIKPVGHEHRIGTDRRMSQIGG